MPMHKMGRANNLVAAAAAQQAEIPAGFEERTFGIPLAKEGDVLEGTYEGPGKPKKLGKGKKSHTVPMFVVVTKSGAKVEVLGSSQLEQFFSTCKSGDEVWVQHTGQIQAGQFGRVNTYRTAVRPGKKAVKR